MKKIRFLFAFSVVFLCLAGLYGQDSPLRIIEQPKPALPQDYGTLCAQGTVALKVQFLASGQVGEIIPVVKMPVRNLTGLALEAAKKIKFEPETRDGNPKDRTKLVRYLYGWQFGGWKIPAINDAENSNSRQDTQAEAILKKAIQHLGGDKYLKVTSQIGRGKYSVIRDKAVVSFQTFVDVIVFPDKERTEFKGGGVKSIQTNTGNTGWVFDGNNDLIKEQNENQVKDFKRGMRVNFDNLLRGYWRNEAALSYVGKRPATLGKRNDVVKLTYNDGLIVEFEFTADDGLPVKAIYKRLNPDNEEITEEDRYAQFVDVNGIKAPYIIDRFTNGLPSSRINYESVEFNNSVSDSIFNKPTNPKNLKKDLKL